MRLLFLTLLFCIGLVTITNGQDDGNQKSDTPTWTEEDREYLLENLTRSKEELTKEVQNLTEEQWNFKENSDRWSINQIVEHLAIYELIFMNQISVALQMGEFPQIKKYPADSLFLGSDTNKNSTTDFTKPFSYSVPLGNNDGIDNLIWLTTMRNDSIKFIRTDERNLRLYYVNFGPDIHQKCMQIFSHTDRHLKQIKNVKSHPNYPKS
ncbi:DinB family protein [Ekhidna sp.]|uniref:DinB family protein n=1 Tax=Ekhidna sp. TaxID=2608089 RepID=UPI003297C736